MADSKKKESKSKADQIVNKLGNKKFTKEQIESIRNSPMMVKKRKEAEEAFASEGYKKFNRENLKKKPKPKK